eukprot:snap_masked-scaffold_1-processed-gene-21.23-mRNA-1 protein AED:1.00 eAED:1.00 QI:0/0/0/0/1/1/3/0/93
MCFLELRVSCCAAERAGAYVEKNGTRRGVQAQFRMYVGKDKWMHYVQKLESCGTIRVSMVGVLLKELRLVSAYACHTPLRCFSGAAASVPEPN